MTLPAADDRLLLIHNPRCSKSRALEAALVERGLDFEIRLYLDEPLDAQELSDLFGRLDRPAIDCVRSKEEEYGQAGLESDSDTAAVVDAVIRFPRLLERPILVRGRSAEFGRPTERALGLLED